MEPENRFHQHVESGRKVIPPPNMTEFMRQNCIEMIRRHALRDAFWQEQYRPENPKYPWLQ
jgi:hypothetical protein